MSFVRIVLNAFFSVAKDFGEGAAKDFPVSSLVKQFIHVTRAPPALIHPNVF